MSHPDYDVDAKFNDAELAVLASDDAYSKYEDCATDFSDEEITLKQMIAAADADDYQRYQEHVAFDPSRSYGYSNSLYL